MSFHTDRVAALAAKRAKAAKRQTAQATTTPAPVGNACPTCGASGSDPCVTPSGKVKDTPHAKRSS